MSSYWRRAWKWARNKTRTYTLPKAVPSVAIAIWQNYLSGIRTQAQILSLLATIAGVYLILWTLELVWNLFVRAPVALDNERLAEIECALRAQRDSELTTQQLVLENHELKQLRRTPAQVVLFDQAKAELQRLGPAERSLLVSLLKHEEIRHEELKQQLVADGFSDQLWSDAIERLKAGNLIEAIPPNSTRQYNAFRINPIYQEPLLELLHSDR